MGTDYVADMEQFSRTNTSFLVGLCDPQNDAAWAEFHSRFRPLILTYAKRRGLQDADAEDAAQDTLADFARAYKQGQYDRSRGRLRHWLGGFAARRIARVRADQRRHVQPIVGSGNSAILRELPDPHTDDEVWEAQWKEHTLTLCMQQVRQEFDERHVRGFEQHALQQRPADEVARELGLSRNALYVAKSRILARIREIQAEIEEAM